MGNLENKRGASPQTNRWRNFRPLRRIAHGKRSTTEPSDVSGILISCADHSGDCPVCCLPVNDLLQFSTCSHTACVVCWLTFICTEIESFAMSRLTCIGCKIPLHASTVINLLATSTKNPTVIELLQSNPDQLVALETRCVRMLSRYEEFLLHKALAAEKDSRWCPNGCGYGVIAHGFKRCPQLFCQHPECIGFSFCYNCQRPWITDSNPHEGSSSTTPVHRCCLVNRERSDTVEGVVAFLGLRRLGRRDSLRTERSVRSSPGLRRSSILRQNSRISEHSNNLQPGEHPEIIPFVDDIDPDEKITHVHPQVDPGTSSTVSDSVLRKPVESDGKIKPCPKCNTLIQKVDDGSCNDMVCSVCGFNFCWLCLRANSAGHYLVLDGCSIWGKRRWSTRRRLLVLLTVLLVTPIVLPLVLAIGIPVGSISLIALSCQLAHSHFRNRRHVRCFALFCTCLGALLFFPVLTVAAAAILTPVVLGFIYIYLPINVLRSLCKQQSIPDSPAPDALLAEV